jgi:hypothetical protein
MQAGGGSPGVSRMAGMDQRRSELGSLLFAAFLVAILCSYAGAYFYAGTVAPVGPGIVRMYRGKVLANVFSPIAVIETWVTGQPVYIGHR